MADLAGAVASIEERLTANWTTTPIGFENQAEPVKVDASGNSVPWVFCEVVGNEAAIAGFGTPGANTILETGMIFLHVFAPAGSGRGTARLHAVALGEIFRQREFYDADPGACVRTRTPRVSPGGPGSDDGVWWRVTCSVPFEFYHRG